MVCGLSDPFCDHARGAKYPDVSSVRTLSFSREEFFRVTTNGLGNGYALFVPHYSNSMMTTAETIGSGYYVNTWNNFTPAVGPSGVEGYRIVSCGFKLYSTATPMTAKGLVSLRSWPTELLSDMAGVDTLSLTSTSSLDIPLADCHQVTAVFQKTPQLPTTFYQAIGDTAVTNGGSKGYYPITLLVSGGPENEAVLFVKAITHFELTFNPNDYMQQLATPPPIMNPTIVNAAGSVTSSIGSALSNFAERGAQAFGLAIENRVKAALSSAFTGSPGAASGLLAITVD